MNAHHRMPALIAILAVLTASSCSSPALQGASTSALPPSAIAPTTTTAVATTSPAAATTLTPTTLPASTTAAATTPPTSAPLGDAQACPLGALDKASGVTNLTVWFDWFILPGDTFKALVDRFNHTNPKIHVDAQFQDPNAIRTKYLTSITSGVKPDLLSLQSTGMQSILDSKTTVPFGACLAADGSNVDDMLPVVKAIGMSGDTLTALPFGQGGQLLYYRKSVFLKAGLDPNNPPSTLDEIRADSKAIMSSGAAKHGISMYATQSLLTNTLATAGQPWSVQPDSGGRATHLSISTDLGVTTLTTLHDMVASGELLAFPNGPSPDAILAVGTGDVGMAIAGANGLGDVEKFITGSGGDLSDSIVGPQPSFGPVEASSYTGAGKAMFIVQNGDPAKVEAAYRFLQWLNQPTQIVEFSSATGTIPTTTTAAALMKDFWAKDPNFEVAYDQAVNRPHSPDLSAPIGPWDQIVSILDPAVIAIINKGADPKSTLDKATKDADAALADYNQRVPA